MSLIPGQKIPHTMGQLVCTTATQLQQSRAMARATMCFKLHAPKACAMQQEKPLQLEAQAPSSPTAGESPCVATQHSQK